MSDRSKPVERLTVGDLEEFPVWEYSNDDEKHDGTAVRPVKKTPVKNLTGRLVGTRVRTAGGEMVWALIGNIDVKSPRLTQHFLTLSVFRDGRWFTLARYHDIDAKERGPDALANFLGLQIDEVFPISYDVHAFSYGDQGALVGTIEEEPRERLTRAQIIALAVP